MTEAELDRAFIWLECFMRAYRPELLAMARGRFAEGVLRYPDAPLYRKTEAELVADVAQEIADALVYGARKIALPAPALQQRCSHDERGHDEVEQEPPPAEDPLEHRGVGQDRADDDRAHDERDDG